MKNDDRYRIARADFEALETIAELDDQMELDAERENLMRDPTKEMAAKMYESGIFLWFQEHGPMEGTEDIQDRHRKHLPKF